MSRHCGSSLTTLKHRTISGLALMAAGDFEAADQHLKAAIQLNPNYGEARYNLAIILANQGKTDGRSRSWDALSK